MQISTASLSSCIFLIGSALALPATASDFTFAPNIAGGFGNYKWNVSIEGGTVVGNPPLYLARGTSYTFDVSTSSGAHPFYIKTAAGAGTANAYGGTGLSANGITSATATITFDV